MKHEFNEGYYHEAMDRLFVIQCMIEDYLIKHPASKKHPEIQEKIAKAQELLAEAYQDFGQFW